MARRFAGSTDWINLALGNLGFAFGPGTVAFIGTHASAATAVDMGIIATDPVAGPAWSLFFIHGTDATNPNKVALYTGGVTPARGPTVLAADGPVCVACSKPTGTSVARYYLYNYGTNVGAHSNSPTTVANSAVPTVAARIGEDANGGDPLSGDLLIVGVWDVVLTDVQKESLPFSLSAWFQVQPRALWMLDQSAPGQKVLDLSGGGANETSLNGTVAVSPTSFPTFNYGDGIWAPTIVKPAGGAVNLTADTGTATTGGTVTLTVVLAVASGTATAVGGTVTLGSVVNLTAATGTATAAGSAQTLTVVLAAANGSATATGPTITSALSLDAATGTATATGGTVTLSTGSGVNLTATTGTATATGGTVTFRVTVTAASGTATASGSTPAVSLTYAAATGAATGAGGTVTASSSSGLAAVAGTATGAGGTNTIAVTWSANTGTASALGGTASRINISTTGTASGGGGTSLLSWTLTAISGTATASGVSAVSFVPTLGHVDGSSEITFVDQASALIGIID